MMNDTRTSDAVDKILQNSIVTYETMGRKTTIGHAQLPNGYEITVTSACINPNNFDRTVGIRICKRKLRGEIADVLAIQQHPALLSPHTPEEA